MEQCTDGRMADERRTGLGIRCELSSHYVSTLVKLFISRMVLYPLQPRDQSYEQVGPGRAINVHPRSGMACARDQ